MWEELTIIHDYILNIGGMEVCSNLLNCAKMFEHSQMFEH